MTVEAALKEHARALGFSLVGIARAGPADGFARLRDWLANGFAGSMNYMSRHAEARRDPASILPEVRSVVMVAMEYSHCGMAVANCRFENEAPRSGSSGRPQRSSELSAKGKIARYARGPDYHIVLRRKLKELLGWFQSQRPDCHGRAVVDTAPLLERDFARRAGLGWIGKNTMLINKYRGSYFFLGSLLVDLELAPDDPHAGFHCGACTACLDACPTGAFPAAGWLDARKCISYLTIELRGPMPAELRPEVGDWLFGCDICQEVCPWNRKDKTFPEAVDPVEMLQLDEDAFRRRFGGTALERTRRRGLVRNAAIVLGNTGDERALPPLRRALDDYEPIVRDAAQWAIEQIERRQSG
jgi:epoxyqueuosine reductase